MRPRNLKFGGVTPGDLSTPVIRLCLSAAFGRIVTRRRLVCGMYKGAPLALLGQAIYGPPWPRDLFEPVPDKWLTMSDEYFILVAGAWPCDHKTKERAVLADGGVGNTTYVYMAEIGERLTLLAPKDTPPPELEELLGGMRVKQVAKARLD